MKLRGMTGAVAAGALVLAVGVGPARAQSPLDRDFETAAEASADYTPGACYAPSWLGANDGAVSQSSAVSSDGSYSLALPIRMTGGSFDQAGVSCVLPDPRPQDLTTYTGVTFAIFAPAAGLRAELVFNDPWHQASTPARDLAAGWNTLSYDITTASPDFPGGIQEGKELVLRVSGTSVTFTGVAYVDSLRFVRSTSPVLQVLAPQRDETIATPVDAPYEIRATATAGAGRTIAGVSWEAGSQRGALTYDAASGAWRGGWDVWRAGDGVRALTVTATDSARETTSIPATVLVRNGRLDVTTLSPGFDAVLRGTVRVTATVTPDPRFTLRRVELRAGGERLRGEPHGGRVTFSLDTRRLRDGVHTLRVVAGDARFTRVSETDLMVENHPAPWRIVRARGTRFDDGHALRFVGANEYELFTRVDQTTGHVQDTVTGRVIPKETTIPWREQIDRQMLESARRHITVLRTWAFDDNPDSFAFQPQLGVYNEDAFRKLDYIADSARRHGIRVILTFTNYWGDYGGIGRYTSQLGLANKNQFFTDAQARAYYERYVEHLVDRVNTVSGVRYKDDATVFAWELMNEPRMDCADDPTPGKLYCDASGHALHDWLAAESAYVKRLDPRHMVASGAEAHGLVHTPSGPFQWARADEGDGNEPWAFQDVQAIDFLTFHPYPNASWAQYSLAQTRDLVRGLVRSGVRRGKPVVMAEYGIFRSQPITDAAGAVVPPSDPRFAALRTRWYGALLEDCYDNGCAGSNVWMIADWSDPDLNVNLYLPRADAVRDAAIVALLDGWGARLEER